MNDVLTLILGGGRGARLFPLTHMRSKPAVPIGGKYRLIDIPISNCLHAGLKRIFVLTQFNSASLNRHIAQTYRLDMFSDGFVEVLAAEQTPESSDWFQGTADAVRQAARHFAGYDADHYLILAGDHLYRMDFYDLIESHIESRADITIAAQPVTPADATQMGIFRFESEGRSAGFEEKPTAERLAENGDQHAARIDRRRHDRRQAVRRLDGHLRLHRARCCSRSSRQPGIDFGKEIIPKSLATHRVHPYIFRGYWADVGTIEAFYDANIQLTRRGAPFNFFHPRRPIYTHPRFLPGNAHLRLPHRYVHRRRGLLSRRLRDDAIRSSASVPTSSRAPDYALGPARRGLLRGGNVGASECPLGIGRNVILDRVIVDKNARIGDGVRLVNEKGVQHADGDGYYIRSGIIIVPKGGTVIGWCDGLSWRAPDRGRHPARSAGSSHGSSRILSARSTRAHYQTESILSTSNQPIRHEGRSDALTAARGAHVCARGTAKDRRRAPRARCRLQRSGSSRIGTSAPRTRECADSSPRGSIVHRPSRHCSKR